MVIRKNTNTIILALLVCALFAASYYPIFQLLVEKWLTLEEYSHAFLILPIILYMVWDKRSVLVCDQVRYSSGGLILVLFATLFYFFAMLTQVHTIISLSMVLTVLGVLVYLAGINAAWELFTPLILLLLLIPVPEQLYVNLTFPLQLKVSQVSELVVGMFGVPILREGNVMNIPTKSFEVVEACSGMRSIISLVTLSIIMGYFMLETKVSKLVLLIASLPIAILINIIRVTAMILLFHLFSLDLTEGSLHTMTGLMLFGMAMIMLLLLHKGLEYWEAK